MGNKRIKQNLIAIPFSAIEAPNEKSEFSSTDITLCLTVSAYLSNKFRNDAFLIEYQPMFFDIQNDRFYEFNIDYTESNSTSAFITLCPQNTTKTIWDHQHNKWVGNVSFIVRNKNRRCVAATVHGHNSTTNFNHKGKKLDQPFFFLP
ncbi:DUF3645 domain-containing protein [bacterium]|nr:DUF3645 domain-containing protein [bacterium]